MKKYLLIAAGLTALVAGSALSPSPAQASWAESAQGNPVHTGTNQSLWLSERGERHFSYRSGPRYSNPGYSAYGAYTGGYYGGGYSGPRYSNPGYSAYGAYPGGYYGGAYDGGYYRY